MGTIQDQAAKMTREAAEALLRAVSFLPEDKMDWSPLGEARTVRDIVAECITSAEGVAVMLTTDFTQGRIGRAQFQDRRQQIMENYKSVKSLLDLARAKFAELDAVVASTHDGRLEQEFRMPFAPDRPMTGVDLLFATYWNLVYHLGQVNYLQMMLGDTAMH